MRPVFVQKRRGLADLLLVGLCLWAAAYHTPLGALVRSMAGWATGVRTSAQPLLAYYTGGIYGEAVQGARMLAAPTFRAPPSTTEALAWGVHAVLSEQPQGRWQAARVLAGQERTLVAQDTEAVHRTLATLLRNLESEEAAVLAFFYGEEVARFALERAQASGEEVGLPTLRRHLPPGSEEALALSSRALMLGTAYSLRWPVSARAPLTSPFGEREHPVLGGRRMHKGVDIGLPVGTVVSAVAAGRVVRASEDAVNGRIVVVDHGRGVTSAYLHNSELRVQVGQEVQAGQTVALSGNTGLSSGPHLHYQLELGGEPVDPLRFRSGPALPVRTPGTTVSKGASGSG